MTNDNDERLAAWLADGPAHGPAGGLESALARTRSGGQRPGWLVAATGGTIAQSPAGGQLRFGLVAAALLLVTVVAGAIIAGGLFNPSPNPAPSPLVIASPRSSAEPSPAPVQGRIVYTQWRWLAIGEEDCRTQTACVRSSVFTVNQDGSDERELVPGPRSEVLAMPPDGSSMLIGVLQPNGDYEILINDGHGSEFQVLDLCGEVPCEGRGFAFSPDGTELAFVRTLPGDGDETVIAILHLRSGVVEELESTRAENPDLGDPCHSGCGAGFNDGPSWSPDGEHLLFSRLGIGIPNTPRIVNDTALFVVDADGGNLRQLVPTELFARDARWSPDGSLIAFTSAVEQLAGDVPDNWQELNDVYTVRPDGSDLRRLTTDTAGPVGTTEPIEYGARFPTWTRDGRIVFSRNVELDERVWQVWIMDGDGANPIQIDPSDVPTLTAIGCVACPYPSGDPLGHPTPAFWIPAE